jgi:hypothetical protein
MNGAHSLLATLTGNGIGVCFANPGTSEMHIVAALDQVTGMRCVLGLFEGVVTGAADGYARMAGRPAATLLHLGPGLANGLSNLHNAMRKNGLSHKPFTLLIWVAWVKMIKGHVTPWPVVFHSFTYQSVPSTLIFLPPVRTCG